MDTDFFCGEEKNGKGKEEKNTRPSILWVTHQMNRKKRNHPVGSAVRYKMMNCIK